MIITDRQENRENSRGKRKLWLIVLILSAAVFLITVAGLLSYFWPMLFPKKVPAEPKPTASEQSTPADMPVKNPIDFDKLKTENPEVCGWIRMPGTVIDYPVMQSGVDTSEDFYLNHDSNKKYKFAGSIYMQKLNCTDFTDPNTLLYGHNMLNGTMFAALKKYRNAKYFDENPTFYVYTPGHILTYTVYSSFVYDDRHILSSFNCFNADDFEAFLEETRHPKSMVRQMREGVTVTTEDRIVTLSTCTSAEKERYLVVGVLTDDTPTD